MLQDVLHGAHNEIDSINGAAIKAAGIMGVPPKNGRNTILSYINDEMARPVLYPFNHFH
jgi:ketopantoate reductase